MRTMRLTGGAGAALGEAQAPQPQPGPGELLVRVKAAGVTPTELVWYPTTHHKDGEKRVGAVPSHEFSGVVEALGEDVNGFEPGREVYGMNDWFADGALAEYCLTQPSWIAPKPARLTHAEAASVPIGALTAWQGLFDRAKLRQGERVLVHGGAGAVGVYAVQLARNAGAHVSATASARNVDFLSELGAEQAIDYHATRFEDAVRDIDVVFDAVGGETLQRSWGVLGSSGRLVTIAAGGEATDDQRTKDAFFIVEPSGDQLRRVGKLLDQGEIKPFVDAEVPFEEAEAAFAGKVEGRRGRGKIVVAVAGT